MKRMWTLAALAAASMTLSGCGGAALAALTAELETQQETLTASQEKIVELEKQVEEVTAERDELQAQLDKLTAKKGKKKKGKTAAKKKAEPTTAPVTKKIKGNPFKKGAKVPGG